MIRNILLANPRGFCAGVVRAIDIVEKALEQYGAPIYVRHQIVHNEHVVTELEAKGAVFVESLQEVPAGSRVIFSAHGTAPDVKREADRLGLTTIDAVCPLVTKVHNEAERFFRRGYEIILIGHRGHQEVIGTMGHTPMTLVESVEDVDSLTIESERITFLTQTTLSMDDTKDIVAALKKKYPHIENPPKDDICYATTNRQNAVKILAENCDMILVIGSENSSNSRRLVETALYCGVESHLIPDKNAIRDEWFIHCEAIGLTSGASAPEVLVQEVIDYFREKFPEAVVETIDYIDEDVHFNLPMELR